MSNDPMQSISTDCPKITLSPRWIRVEFNNQFVADSKQAVLLREYGAGKLPTYYFPTDDVDMSCLTKSQTSDEGECALQYWTINVDGKVLENAAWSFLQTTDEYKSLENHITFQWDAMDAWYEEDEEIFVHARDPYKRIDVIQSTRHVRVELDGIVLAESKTPCLLFETNLPTRYYLPVKDVKRELLIPSETTTRCPYKGVAHYWSLKMDNHVVDDIVWSYPDPIAEVTKLRELMCFYNERVDIILDGDLLPRPQNKWSKSD